MAFFIHTAFRRGLISMYHALFVSRENDHGFRELILRLGTKGLLMGGMLGALITAIHVGTHIFLLGRTPVWQYGLLPPDQGLVLIDKTLIVLFCGVAIVLSRMNISIHVIRLVFGFIVVAICVAILADDILNGDAGFSAGYFALVLLVAVGTIPYKPLHTLVLGLAVAATLYVGIVRGSFSCGRARRRGFRRQG